MTTQDTSPTLFRSLGKGISTTVVFGAIFGFILNLIILSSTALLGLAGKFLNTIGIGSAVDVLEEKLDRQTKKNADLAQRNKKLEVENRRMERAIATNKQLTSRVGKRIGKRTAIGLGRNVAAVPFESAPVIGISVIAATTALEVSDACATMADIDQVFVSLGLEPEYGEYQQKCVQYGYELEEMKVSLATKYSDAKAAGGEALQDAKESYDRSAEASGEIYEISVERATDLMEKAGIKFDNWFDN